MTRRFARQRENREFDYDLDRVWGYKAGMWSTPTAARCWTAAIVIAVVVARERAGGGGPHPKMGLGCW